MPAKPKIVERRYSIREASELTSISKEPLRLAIISGQIRPVEKIGKRWLIPASSLEAYLRKGRL